jgi:cysteine desulfurase
MIYLDHNATTPLRPEAFEAMRQWLTSGQFGNPASAHAGGRRARQALEGARESVAALLRASPDEVIFTSGATEANNLAIFGLCDEPPGRILASPIEHPCVIEPLNRLEERAFTIDWLPVTAEGLVPIGAVADRIHDDTRLVTVMLANHETGTVQPVEALRPAAGGSVEFHCDAAQAVGKMPVDFHALDVTSLSISGHKFGGPAGIGALLLKRGARLMPLLFGGHQQQGRRPGTEPVALAVGFAAALEVSVRDEPAMTQTMLALRGEFLDALLRGASPVVLNGPATSGLPNTLNLSFPGCRSDALLMSLDLAGVACSTGSACSSGSLLPSPVLKAMSVPGERLRSAMRFSFGWPTTSAELVQASSLIVKCVNKLRQLKDM